MANEFVTLHDKEGDSWVVNVSQMNEDTKERQIAENERQAKEKNTGIPSTMPTKEQLLKKIKKLKGKDLEDAIYRLDSLGHYYREDKRQKRGYLEEVVKNVYNDDPASAYDVDVTSNLELIEVVTGINYRSNEFKQKFGIYDVDRLYERVAERSKKGK